MYSVFNMYEYAVPIKSFEPYALTKTLLYYGYLHAYMVNFIHTYIWSFTYCLHNRVLIKYFRNCDARWQEDLIP